MNEEVTTKREKPQENRGSRGRFKKGHKLGGHPKGQKNYTSREAAQEVIKAFYELGGAEWLKSCVKTHKDRKLMATVLAKVLPSQVEANVKIGGLEELVLGDAQGEEEES